MNYNYKLLKTRIRRYYGSQEEFAKVLHLSTNSLNKKLNNKVCFNQREISIMIDTLDIKKLEIKDYFFTLKVQ